MLVGEFKDKIVGDDYLLPNVLSEDDRVSLKGLVAASDPLRAAWLAAVDGLATTLQTFVESTSVPGTYVADPARNLAFTQAQSVEVTSDEQAVDSYALTGVGGGSGYVTLILGNGRAFTNPSEPVQVQILRVSATDLYRGQVKPVVTANPLAEDLTLTHTGDFAGRAEDYEFQWYYTPPVNGQPPSNLPGEPGTSWFQRQPSPQPRITVGATQPLLTLTDNYYVMRHRPRAAKDPRSGAAFQAWSAWTQPALAEGWVKRVLAGINPFNQRVSDFYNNTVNTNTSLISQAGTRWEGDIPLTLQSVQDAGLIEIYETVLRRGLTLSVEGTPAVNYGPANDALVLAAGYLADLYLALGNEAYSDAANPLISLDVDPSRLLTAQGLPASIGQSIRDTATSRFSFEGQVGSLLDEELALLRGRDDAVTPGARLAPVYNRLYWNFTRGINAGEVIYALNYNIQERAAAGANGIVDAAAAARQYPQGHGDAHGHYLTAVTNFYSLLSNPNFTWTPKAEAVNVLGVPVTVDYQNERRFATAAVSLGRAASRVIDLERRKLPVGTDSGWAALRDASAANATTGVARAWGVEQWAARAGQGNFLHWAVINALLPENDNANSGVRKVDRQNVPELTEMTALAGEIQTHLDGANQHANALNLSDNSVLFDLSPSQLAAGQSHFDQILARAKSALNNAAIAHARSVANNALLRTLENQSADYTFTVSQQETAFTNRLLDLYGRPYAGDVAPGKFYPQDYDGPDLLRFMYITRSYIYPPDQLFGNTAVASQTPIFQLPVKLDAVSSALGRFTGTANNLAQILATYRSFYGLSGSTATATLSYPYKLNDGPYQIATTDMGSRPASGQLQAALAQVLASREALFVQLRSLSGKAAGFAATSELLRQDLAAREAIYGYETALSKAKLVYSKTIGGIELANTIAGNVKTDINDIIEQAVTSLPMSVGLSADPSFAIRGTILAQKIIANKVISAKEISMRVTKYFLDLGFDLTSTAAEVATSQLNGQIALRARITSLQSDYSAVFATIRDLDAANQAHLAAIQNYQNLIDQGQRIQAERETFRQRAAAVVQGVRTRDVALRAFRTESLEQFKILFDQAARYAFLAAQAYDYETAQLGSPSGRDFLASIVACRSLGLVMNGEPQIVGSASGDAGLSTLLARLQADWNVAKGRLGITNPDTYGTLFSLRRELLNLPYREDGTTEDHTAWQDRLRSYLVADLRAHPAVAAHALPTSNPTGLAQPGFVIPFSSAIETGQNFFGNPLGGGDSAYSTASFSTKVNSVGVVFQGYIGMNPYASGSTGVPGAPSSSSPDALAATPYVYLLPAGVDLQRTPPLNGAASVVRSWPVFDHAMPLPFDIGAGGFGQTTSWNSSTSLTEPFFLPRRHQPFRAVADPTLFYSRVPDDFTNRRLIGRSAWNTNWVLVIPAQTLLANPQDGIERFVRSVHDIKLYLRTYSAGGN